MLPTGAADKLLQWDLVFSPASKPGAVDSIAGPVDITVPDALKAKQNIALQLRSDLLQFISKPDYGRGFQAPYRPKRPFVLRPLIRGHKLDIMPGFCNSICNSFQVRLGATALRITATNKSDAEFLFHAHHIVQVTIRRGCVRRLSRFVRGEDRGEGSDRGSRICRLNPHSPSPLQRKRQQHRVVPTV